MIIVRVAPKGSSTFSLNPGRLSYLECDEIAKPLMGKLVADHSCHSLLVC